MSITAGLTATKASIELSKLILDKVARPNIDVVDVKNSLHEMMTHAVNAQVALAEAQQEVFELQRQLDDREALRALQADMEYQQETSFYIRKSERDAGNAVPYCPVCWGDSSKPVALVPYGRTGGFICSIHKCVFRTEALQAAIKAENAQAEAERRRHVNPGGQGWMA
jgi:multidrug efflux pump subunit AcrA (membrane-fusion protein)